MRDDSLRPTRFELYIDSTRPFKGSFNDNKKRRGVRVFEKLLFQTFPLFMFYKRENKKETWRVRLITVAAVEGIFATILMGKICREADTNVISMKLLVL